MLLFLVHSITLAVLPLLLVFGPFLLGFAVVLLIYAFAFVAVSVHQTFFFMS